MELRHPGGKLAPAVLVEQVAVHEHHVVDGSEGLVAPGAPLGAQLGAVRSGRLRGERFGGNRRQLDLTDLSLVGLDGRDDDAGFYRDEVDAGEGDADPGVDDDALVQDTVQDIEDTS